MEELLRRRKQRSEITVEKLKIRYCCESGSGILKFCGLHGCKNESI